LFKGKRKGKCTSLPMKETKKYLICISSMVGGEKKKKGQRSCFHGLRRGKEAGREETAQKKKIKIAPPYCSPIKNERGGDSLPRLLPLLRTCKERNCGIIPSQSGGEGKERRGMNRSRLQRGSRKGETSRFAASNAHGREGKVSQLGERRTSARAHSMEGMKR